MNRNLKLVINNSIKKYEEKFFFEKSELKIILDLYAKMVSNGSWKDYGLNISNKQVSFSVFKNAAENAFFKEVYDSMKVFADKAVPFWSGAQMSNAKLGMAHAATLK